MIQIGNMNKVFHLKSGDVTALGKSVAQMNASATACAGLLYDLNPEHFNEWSESVVSALMAL